MHNEEKDLNLGSKVHPVGDRESVLNRYNERYYVTSLGNKVRVVDTETNNNWCVKDFHDQLQEELITVVVPKGDYYVPKNLPVSKEWMKWEGIRKALKGETVDPNLPYGITNGVFNKWKGLHVKPVQNDALADVFKQHVLEVISSGNEVIADKVLNWLAFGVQYPGKPIGVALVLQGSKGCGKGAFFQPILDIWKGYCTHATSSDKLVGRFNAHLVNSPFIFADEAFFAGSKVEEERLKGLITERTFTVEAKGREAYQSQSYFKIGMATNNAHAIAASRDERRYFVVSVSNCKVGDNEYFERYREATSSPEGVSAIYHYLLNKDITKDNVRQVIENDALKSQRHHSLGAAGKFVYNMIQSGLDSPDEWDSECTRKEFYEKYIAWENIAKGNKYDHIEQSELSAYMIKLNVGKFKRGGTRGWEFGRLNDFKELFENHEKVTFVVDDDDEELLSPTE